MRVQNGQEGDKIPEQGKSRCDWSRTAEFEAESDIGDNYSTTMILMMIIILNLNLKILRDLR